MLTFTGNVIHTAQLGMFDILLHGCNCRANMGAGVAKQIKDTWPEAYAADKAASTGDRSMLGSYSCATVVCGRDNERDLVIINAYTQFGFSDGKRDVFEYDAFAAILDRIAIDYPKCIIGMPAIGCGLACGDKERIMDIVRMSPVNEFVVWVEFG